MAIAVDTQVDGGTVNPNTALSWSHTCTGSNRILFVGVTGAVSSDNITSVTYNGVALTRNGMTIVPGDRNIYLYYLIAPATGANTVTISANASIAIAGVSVSYTGVAQTSFIDASTTNTGSGVTTLATSVTTTVDNDWTILYAKAGGVGLTAGTSTTARQLGGFLTGMFDKNAATTPAGSSTLNVDTGAGAANLATVMTSFSPVVVSTSNANFLQFM